MSKECEICGRTIKTGRKYCWEHRNTSQGDAARAQKQLAEDKKLIDHATYIYLNLNLNKSILHKYSKLIFTGASTGLIVLIGIIEFYFYIVPIFVFLSSIVVIPLILGLLNAMLSKSNKNRIMNKILIKDPEYVTFVRNFVRNEKEIRKNEEEFTESLLKDDSA